MYELTENAADKSEVKIYAGLASIHHSDKSKFN